MKLSSTLLQAITLGVSVTAITAATTSCEKQNIKENKERAAAGKTGGSDSTPTHSEPCPACGMG